MARFTDKTAIVTGAGAGIGRATAVRIASEGGRVIASDVLQERLDDLKGEHPELDLVFVAGDVREQAVVDQIVAACEGKLDALCNVAGIMDGFEAVGEVSDEVWDRVIAVNLTSLMRLSRAAIPEMLAGGGKSSFPVGSNT
jgi:NAD(P)-dependent dehydrogenase (short-subunit alcohol dehydrogenase family)